MQNQQAFEIERQKPPVIGIHSESRHFRAGGMLGDSAVQSAVQPSNLRQPFGKKPADVLLSCLKLHEEYEKPPPSALKYTILSALLGPYRLERTLGSTTTAAVTFPTTVRWSNRDEFLHAVRRLLESEPLESGFSHPAETWIRDALRIDWQTRDWVRAAVLEQFEDALAADLLRCIGRLDRQLTGDWGFTLAQAALSSESVNVRDASIQALESWGQSAIGILRAHRDSEQTDWLRSYVDQVIRDLGG